MKFLLAQEATQTKKEEAAGAGNLLTVGNGWYLFTSPGKGKAQGGHEGLSCRTLTRSLHTLTRDALERKPKSESMPLLGLLHVIASYCYCDVLSARSDGPDLYVQK